MITLPSQKTRSWRVAHGRDNDAELINTRNLNFDRQGYLKIANAAIALYTTTDDASFGMPLSIFCDGSLYYVVTSAAVFTTSNGQAFTKLAAITPSLAGDGLYFNGLPHVVNATGLQTYAAGSWTDRSLSFSSSFPHPMCVFESLVQLCIANGNTVLAYNTSYSLQTTLTLPAEYIVTWMKWRQNRLFIGTRNITGNNTKMFIWNGTTTSAQEGYNVQADWIYSGEEFQSSICVVTSAGQLLRFNGGGFSELEHFPVYETPYSWVSTASPASAIGKIASRGMMAHGNVLYINIDGSLTRNGVDYPGNFLPTMPSGLWEYDPKIGMYHKAGYVYTKYQTLTPTVITGNVLTFAAAHELNTGDAVFLRTLGTLTGLTQAQTYFAVKVDSLNISLAFSPADAVAARLITLGGTISTDAFDLPVYNSIGAVYDTTPGCVGRFTNLTFYDFYGTEVMWGGRCINNSNTVISSVMTLGLGENRGGFTTAPLLASGITEGFVRLIEKIKKMVHTTDTIIVKYRTIDRFGVPTPARISSGGFATWTAPTIIAIDSTLKDIKSVQVGDEVAFISGAGAGRIANIAAIDIKGSIYNLTLDETIPYITVGDLSEVVIDNWKVISTFDITNLNLIDGFLESTEPHTGTWIQYKFELRGRDITLTMLQLINSPVKPTV